MWSFKRKKAPEPQAGERLREPPGARSDPVWRAAPQAWRDAPPLQRVIADPPIVNPAQRFSDTLAAWQDPTFLAPLGHRVTPQEPAGVVHDLVTPTKTPDMPVRTLPTVQKASAVMPTTPPTSWEMPTESVSDIEVTEEPTVTPTEHPSTSDAPTAQLITDAPTLGQPSSPPDEAPPPQEEPLAAPLLVHDELEGEAPTLGQAAPIGPVVARAVAEPGVAPLPIVALSPGVAIPLGAVAPVAGTVPPPQTLSPMPADGAPGLVQRAMIGGEPEALSRAQLPPDQFVHMQTVRADLVFQRATASPVQTVRAEPVVQREPAESTAPLLGASGLMMSDMVEFATAEAAAIAPAVSFPAGAPPTAPVRSAPARPVPSATSPSPVSAQLASVQTVRTFPSATATAVPTVAVQSMAAPMRTVVAAPVQRAVVSHRVAVQRDLAEDLYTEMPSEPPTPPVLEVPAEVATEPPPPASATAAPAPASGGAEPEELLKTLFDPLLRKLRTELRMDRERRGIVTDMSRW